MPLEKRRGSDIWQIRFEVRGKRVRQSSGTASRREAEAKERELRTYYERTTPARPKGRVGDLATLAALDLDRAEADKASEKQLAAIEYAWGAITKHMGGTSSATVITFDAVEQYIKARRKDGVSGQTIRKERQRIRWAAGVAHRKGWLPVVPQVWPKIRDDARDEAQAGKLHDLDVLRAWFRRLRDIRKRAYLEARIVVLTGLRSEEAARLSWSWVEETAAGPVLHVPAWAAKTRDERRVGLGREAYALLRSLAKGRVELEPLLGKRYWRKPREAARKSLGYGRPITLRDLRHTFLTLGLESTGDATATQAAAGHTDLRTTQRYLHSTIERAQAVSRGVEASLNRHHKTATIDKTGPSGGRTRVRTEGHLRVKPEPSLIDHVSTCEICQRRIAAHAETVRLHPETATMSRHQANGPA